MSNVLEMLLEAGAVKNAGILLLSEMDAAEMLLLQLALGRILGLLRAPLLLVFGMCSLLCARAAAELGVGAQRLCHSCGIVWCSPAEVELG